MAVRDVGTREVVLSFGNFQLDRNGAAEKGFSDASVLNSRVIADPKRSLELTRDECLFSPFNFLKEQVTSQNGEIGRRWSNLQERDANDEQGSEC